MQRISIAHSKIRREIMNPDRNLFTRSSPLMDEERIKNREEIGGGVLMSKPEKYLSCSLNDGLQVCESNTDANESSMTIDAALLLTSLASNNSKLQFAKTNTNQNHEEFSPFSRLYTILETDNRYEMDQDNEVGIDVKNRNMKKEEENTLNTKLMNDDYGRIRAVSLDNPAPALACSPYESLKDYINDHPTPKLSNKKQNSGQQFKVGTAAISPPHSPRLVKLSSKTAGIRQDNKTDIKSWTQVPSKQVQTCKRNRRKAVLDPRKRFCLRKKQQQQHQKSTKTQKLNQDEALAIPTILQRNKNQSHIETKNITYVSNRRHLQQPRLVNALPTSNHMKKTILRRKFSWKNYPELEAFLIANREEYLRHSALNYTAQQKQYNNRLTERLIELASSHGYVFDEEAFSFVTVRDRIRCYYKSYVQSSKKRGLIIGYAARKAGLLTDDDLEKSAGIEGRIIVPEA